VKSAEAICVRTSPGPPNETCSGPGILHFRRPEALRRPAPYETEGHRFESCRARYAGSVRAFFRHFLRFAFDRFFLHFLRALSRSPVVSWGVIPGGVRVGFAMKVAVTDLSASTLIVQLSPEGVSHPAQPPNEEPGEGTAVRITELPLL
jgi:hypothetical protein